METCHVHKTILLFNRYNVTASGLCLAAQPEERQGVMYSSRVHRMVEEWTTYMYAITCLEETPGEGA